MTQINFKSAGVSARVINLTGPTAIEPVGIPAGVIGTAQKGPAFVPTTVATTQDFVAVFGAPADGAANAPLAAVEWLRNQQALTFTRVLGVGEGKKRETTGNNAGRVKGSGFVVGAQQPQEGGALANNPYANAGGDEGSLYFLNVFMSQSSDSTFLSDAGLPTEGTPLVRAVLMAASGVLLRLSGAAGGAASGSAPAADLAATAATASGSFLGGLNLLGGRQEFVLFLNGHKGASSLYPRVITASLDVDAPNYLGKQLNTNPLNLEKAGYVLYADYPIHPSIAAPTGSGILDVTGSWATPIAGGIQPILFLTTGSQTRNSGTATAPSYENFEDRFRVAHSTWIVSQKFGGRPKNLFKIHALDDGAGANSLFKWSIENITPSSNDVQPYGSFDLLVRSFDDYDKKKAVLEAWRGLSLDPTSPNYIARVIGDQHDYFDFDANIGSQKLVTEGDYPNASNYIRVEMSDEVRDGEIDSTALPMGFRGPAHLVTSGSAPLAALGLTTSGVLGDTVAEPSYRVVQPPVPYRQNVNVGSSDNLRADRALYWGVQFERKISASELNSTTEQERSVLSFTKYFPNFATSWQNVEVEGNEGVADTVANGILDADRFNNNLFTLENVRVTTGSNGLVDIRTLTSWSYVRAGGIANSNGYKALQAADLSDSSVRALAKFSGFLHGGFNGVRIFDNDTLNLTNEAIQEEMDNANRGVADGPTVVAYKKALETVADNTQVDIQLLAIPGIRHPSVTDEAVQLTENRFDAVYLMDIQNYDVSNTLVTGSGQDLSVRFTANQFSTRGLNSSFAAAYWPDVILRDEINQTIRQVPASVAVLGAFALNDTIGHPWFAPAGFSRGALPTTENTVIPLSRPNLDSLLDVRINPLVAFANSDGPLVWGQKTLLASASTLERVNVRRLLVSLRREVKRIANRIVFEPNREETLSRFSAAVNPIFKRVQDQRGIEKFLVRIDTTTTTQTDVENRTIRGKIYLIPTKTLEFLSIDFVVTNNGNFVTST